ncbi:MAG: formate dehydrogenase accessory sulfurtransferase FdhD [Lachnospiraceae bacterium]|nr:formate dehydrogenase accessory sulfurtransferase FdhD [Lachnospiraceae bacterium]
MKIEDKTDSLKKSAQYEVTVFGVDGSITCCEDELICEHFMDIYINDELLDTVSCTPDDLLELAVGRLFFEGIIVCDPYCEYISIDEDGRRASVYLTKEVKDVDSLKNQGIREFATDDPDHNEVDKYSDNGGDISGFDEDYKEIIFRLANKFTEDTELHKNTKGSHICYLYTDNGEIRVFEDISRYNIIYKAIGYTILNNIDSKKCVVFITGRVSCGMVKKIVKAGFPVLISKAVPYYEAAVLANSLGLKLVCKAWPDSYVRY